MFVILVMFDYFDAHKSPWSADENDEIIDFISISFLLEYITLFKFILMS